MSSTQYLIEAQTRHQIQVQRLGGGIVNDLLPLLRTLRDDVAGRIRGATEFQQGRLIILLREIDGLMDAANGEFKSQLMMELEDFAAYEAQFQATMLGKAVTVQTAVPATAQLAAAVTTAQAELVSGREIIRRSIPELVDRFTDAKRQQVQTAIRAGFIEGQTNDQIARNVERIIGRRGGSELRATVRTATNLAASVARQSTFQENADIIESLRRVGTLDSRTTLQCAANDGRIYPIDTTDLPPYHYGCRTTMVPIVAEQYRIPGLEGERPAIGADGVEQVSSRTTYSGFLRRQSAEFQNDVLGPERAKLFRSGKLRLNQFVDDEGRTLTLDQLRQRESITL